MQAWAGNADVGAGLAHGRQARAQRDLAGDEVGPARRAARLGVVVGEQHALLGQLVEVRRLAGHDAAVVGADVEPADVVAHDDEDVRLLAVGRNLCAGRIDSGRRIRGLHNSSGLVASVPPVGVSFRRGPRRVTGRGRNRTRVVAGSVLAARRDVPNKPAQGQDYPYLHSR